MFPLARRGLPKYVSSPSGGLRWRPPPHATRPTEGSLQSSHSFSDPQARILLYELTSASFALSDALTREDSRDEQIAEACQALEAFELLERGPTTFNVPRDVREKVRASLEGPCARAARAGVRVAQQSRRGVPAAPDRSGPAAALEPLAAS